MNAPSQQQPHGSSTDIDFSLSLPAEFDAKFYRTTYSDLRDLTDPALESHYLTYGIQEGRSGSAAATRHGFISLFCNVGSILEIGPMAAPVANGRNVKYFDVLPTDELKAKAAKHGMDASRCPDIDFVSPTGDLSVIDAEFDAVVSSHSVEHQPDLVFHLQQVARLLRPGRFYFLLIPDKRYCFDYFISESTIAEVLDAHVRKKKFHDAMSIIEHTAMTTHNDPGRHWRNDHGAPRFRTSPDSLRGALETFVNNPNTYLDAHAWQFTPSSFREIAELLFDIGVVPLRPVRVYTTPYGSNEFCAVLQSDATKMQGPRLLPLGFDDEDYLRANPDVRAAGVDAKAHYLTFGQAEGRKIHS